MTMVVSTGFFCMAILNVCLLSDLLQCLEAGCCYLQFLFPWFLGDLSLFWTRVEAFLAGH
jgi:hypothetical protein